VKRRCCARVLPTLEKRPVCAETTAQVIRTRKKETQGVEKGPLARGTFEKKSTRKDKKKKKGEKRKELNRPFPTKKNMTDPCKNGKAMEYSETKSKKRNEEEKRNGIALSQGRGPAPFNKKGAGGGPFSAARSVQDGGAPSEEKKASKSNWRRKKSRGWKKKGERIYAIGEWAQQRKRRVGREKIRPKRKANARQGFGPNKGKKRKRDT